MRDSSARAEGVAAPAVEGSRSELRLLERPFRFAAFGDSAQGNNMLTRPKAADWDGERRPKAPLPLRVLLGSASGDGLAVRETADLVQQAANAIALHKEVGLARKVLHARPHWHAAAGNAHLL